MKALLRLQESPDRPDDDESGQDRHGGKVRAWPARRYRAARDALRVRCYACAGSGCLWVMDERLPRGRPMRCVICRGKGRVNLR